METRHWMVGWDGYSVAGAAIGMGPEWPWNLLTDGVLEQAGGVGESQWSCAPNSAFLRSGGTGSGPVRGKWRCCGCLG